MKTALALAFTVLCHSASAQQVKMAESLAPEDLGAFKWILAETANENEVVVFRMTTVRERGGKLTTEHWDTVCYSPGKRQEHSAFFFDPTYFAFEEPPEPRWFFRALHSTGWIEGRYTSSRTSDREAEINFASEKSGRTRKKFEVFVQQYDEAKKLYPKLPQIEPSVGWEWSGSPE